MRTRLYVASVVGGVAAVLVTAFLVFKIGQVDPSPPSLKDNPHDEITGAILYVGTDDCVYRAQASGRTTERIICPSIGDYINGVSWQDAGKFSYFTYDSAGEQEVEVDIASRKETQLPPRPLSKPPLSFPYSPVSARGERISIDPEGDVYRVDGGRERIFDFKGVEGDRPEVLTWSPDGEWVALFHYRSEQIWIVRRDGTVAGTLANSARPSISWWIDGLPPQPARE